MSSLTDELRAQIRDGTIQCRCKRAHAAVGRIISSEFDYHLLSCAWRIAVDEIYTREREETSARV